MTKKVDLPEVDEKTPAGEVVEHTRKELRMIERKTTFLNDLINGDGDEAKWLFKRFGRLIDFTDQIKAGFLHAIKEGWGDFSLTIFETFGEGIDFDDLIKEGFMHLLQYRNVKEAALIQDTLGDRIDFTTIEGYEDAVKVKFIEETKNGVITHSLICITELGEEIDFTTIYGFEDMCNTGILIALSNGHIRPVIEFISKLKLDSSYKADKEVFEDAARNGFLSAIEVFNDKVSAITFMKMYGDEVNFDNEIFRTFSYPTYNALGAHLLRQLNDNVGVLKEQYNINNTENITDSLLEEIRYIILPFCEILITRRVMLALGLPSDTDLDNFDFSTSMAEQIPSLLKEAQNNINGRLSIIFSEEVMTAYGNKYGNGGEVEFMDVVNNL